MSRIIANVNESLNKMRYENNITEYDVAKYSGNLYTIASKNKTGNKIMASVPLYLIYIDESYQRTETFSRSKANEIANNFIEAAYDPVKLNYRDGKFFCPAGQHRIFAHILMGRECIDAELFSTSYEEEINIFLTQDDNRSKLTPYDRYKAGLAGKRKEDVLLHDICDKYNVVIAKKTRKDNRLGSITTAKDILSTVGETGLDWIMSVISESGWISEKRGLDSRTFRMLRKVYKTSKGEGKGTVISLLSNTTPALLYANAVSRYPNRDSEMAMQLYIHDEIQGKVGKITRLKKAN